MSTVFARRFNFGFVLFSLVILSSLTADTDHITTDGVPDLSKEIKPTEKFSVDELNSISRASQTDNSIDGDLNITTRAHAETETDNLSTTETNRNSEVSHNTSVESKSITTTETSHRYNSIALSETTVVRVEDDQMTTANTEPDASWTAKVNTTIEPVQKNSIQHQENINQQFTGNSVDDISNSSADNKTAIADPLVTTNAKPTKDTIMGVGIKTTVSVSLRVQDAKITGENLTDAEMSARNSSCKNSFANNSIETTNSIPRNDTCYEAMENVTIAENTNETAQHEPLLKSSSESPPLKSPPETDQQNNTEISWNTTGANETESRPHYSSNTEIYPDNRIDISSKAIHNSTEASSNVALQNKTENELNSTQLNATEINLIHNIAETTMVEESSNATEVPTTEHKITDMSLSGKSTTETYTDPSASQFTITNNETFESSTTHIKTHAPVTSKSWPSTDTENTTDADLMTTTPQPIITFSGVMKIMHGLNWSAELRERQSPQYKKAAKHIQSLLEDVFSTTALAGILKEVEIDGFSQGSVLVDYYLILVESDALDPDYLVHAFNSYFKSNNTYSGFTIDPKATEFEVRKIKAIKPTAESRVEPPVPQWVVAVVVISAASLVFIILFAAVTIYGRHYGRRSYNKKLQGDEIIFDKPDYQSGPRLSDAAYENLAADAVYDVEGSPEKIDGMANNRDNEFDSWRTNRLTRMPSTKRFSFNSS